MIVAVSEGIRNELLSFYSIPPNKSVTIYNPILSIEQISPPSSHSVKDTPKKTDKTKLISVGRLTHQKGFDLLILALFNISHRKWLLEIWGDGPERYNLQNLIERLHLERNIFLKGHTKNPIEKLRTAEIFILPSRYEGLPTTLIEAMACQLKIIATDCPQGPREILEDGRHGMLVPSENVALLTESIEGMLADELIVDYQSLLNRSRDFMIEKNSMEWLSLLNKNLDNS